MSEPIRATKGSTDIGPRDPARDAENPDVLVPPSTDKGLVPNLRFSFADAHMNLQDGGWSREVTQRELPIATEMAGVNMRLKTGGVRELHWHKQAEWSIMLAGNARITAVDNDGKNFVADIAAGDLWYFPAGIPHSIQRLGPDGCEFLLAFPDGAFSESSTFLLSEVLARTPKDVLATNFDVPESAFDRIPKEQLRSACARTGRKRRNRKPGGFGAPKHDSEGGRSESGQFAGRHGPDCGYAQFSDRDGSRGSHY